MTQNLGDLSIPVILGTARLGRQSEKAAKFMAREVKKGFKVLAIDISETAIKITKERAKKENLEVNFKVGDVLKLNEQNQFDLIIDRGCFHHITTANKPRFVALIKSALKKNSKYLLTAFSDKNQFEKSLSKKDIGKFFSEYFTIGKIKEEFHIEPDGNKVYFYTTVMTNDNKISDVFHKLFRINFIISVDKVFLTTFSPYFSLKKGQAPRGLVFLEEEVKDYANRSLFNRRA